MPQVTHTAGSAAIDFLSGFGEGMVQNDINRREKEVHEMQQQKWQRDMTAYAAQDELRKMQLENSRLEIDMRKTQFADIQATRGQTKGFVSFMASSIGKVSGNPAERQSQLLEAYLQGSSEFPMADRSIGDKMIDIYSKIHQAGSTRKAWKFADVKDYETGKKRRAIIDETGSIINYIPGEENLEVVNDIVDNTMTEYNDELDMRLQTFLAGKSAVVSAESGLMSFDDFVNSVAADDDRTKAEKAMDWIFETRTRLMKDMHEETGTLETRLGRRLSNVMKDDATRTKFIEAYAGKPDHTSGLERILGKFGAEERMGKIAAMEREFEALIPGYEMPEVRMELARLQNKAVLEMKNKKIEQTTVPNRDQMEMTELATVSKREKEEGLLKKFFGASVPGTRAAEQGRSWWDDFLGKGMPETVPMEDRDSEAYETVRAMQERR